MIYLSELVLIILTVGMAYWHSRLIAAGRPIKHDWWAALFAILVAGAVVLLWYRLTVAQWGLYAGAQFIGHLVVFNVALNRFRGLPWTYTSTSTGSILDKIELRLFGSKVWLLEIFLGVVYLSIQLFL